MTEKMRTREATEQIRRSIVMRMAGFHLFMDESALSIHVYDIDMIQHRHED